MEQLNFSISGEFITDLVRCWFWDEHKDYQICEDLLLNCLINDILSEEEKKSLALEIIEGKKKLIGINDLELIDDGENIRPLIQMVDYLKKESTINKIKEDMFLNPLKYVDEFSTLISYRAAKELHLNSQEDVMAWFSGEKHDGRVNDIYYESETKMGLWLLDRPDLIYNVLKGPITASNREIFFEKLYDYIGTDNLSDYMERRQYRYSLDKKHKTEKNRIKSPEEIIEDLKTRNEIIDKLYHSEINRDIDEMTKKEYDVYIQIENQNTVGTGLFPDEIKESTGLIDKNGDFYTCSFGHHNIKAYYLILMNFERFGYSSRKEARKNLNIELSLDTLISNGWIATRYLPTMGNYLEVSDSYNPTKRQIDKIWEVMIKFDIMRFLGLENIMK